MLFDVFPLSRFHNVSKFNVWKFKIWKFNTNFNHNNFFQNFVCTYNSNLQTQWPMMNFTFLNLKFPNLPSPLEQRIPPRRCGSLGDWMKCWNPGEMKPESCELSIFQFFQILYVSENCFHWRLDEMLEPRGDETWIGKTLIDLSTCVNFQFFRVLYVPDCFLKTVFWVPNFENCLWSLTLLSEEPIPKLNSQSVRRKRTTITETCGEI